MGDNERCVHTIDKERDRLARKGEELKPKSADNIRRFIVYYSDNNDFCCTFILFYK